MPTFDLNEAATDVLLAGYAIARTVRELDRRDLEWVGMRRKYVSVEFGILIRRARGGNGLRGCLREVPCGVFMASL